MLAQFVIFCEFNEIVRTITNKNKEWLKNGSLLLAVKRNIFHFGTSHQLGVSVTLNTPRNAGVPLAVLGTSLN